MSNEKKTLEFSFERTIPASLEEVYDGWLDAKVPGNPWNMAEKFLLNPEVDGLFYWTIKGNSHYGRFIEVARPRRLQHTWMSPSTLGQETTVTITFEKKGDSTLMKLVHSDLPDQEVAKNHEKGWNSILDAFSKSLVAARSAMTSAAQ